MIVVQILVGTELVSKVFVAKSINLIFSITLELSSGVFAPGSVSGQSTSGQSILGQSVEERELKERVGLPAVLLRVLPKS